MRKLVTLFVALMLSIGLWASQFITVNVTVPMGTPACYFYGEMSGNTFVEMKKLDDTHYTVDFPDATSIGWGYKFVWENGNWATANSDPEGDFSVEPDVNGEINIEIRAWGTSPTPIPPAPAECKYTEYENWQIKFGPDWTWSDNMTKVEDGLFKMEIEWDGTGFNIKSDENPIKKDWFPVEELVIGEEVIAPVIVDVYLKVIDDETLAISVGVNPNEPTPPAPTPIVPELTAPQVPTVDAANVKAIMCETYNNDLGYWPQGWGGCNWVDTCRAGVNIKYANTMAWDCFASDWQGAGVADYANLHFDIWFAEDGNAPIIKLEFNGTDPTAEITIPGEYKAGWNSVNVNVEETFGEQPMDNLKCLTVKVTKEGGAVAWANILFFNGEYTSQVSTGYCGDAPAECKYTEYENWQIKFGPDWTWSDNMTKLEDGLFSYEIQWPGLEVFSGINIKSDENPIKKDWYALDDADVVVGEEIPEGVLLDIMLVVVDDEHIRIGIGTNPGVGPTDAINIINTEDVPNGAIIKDGKVYIIRDGKVYNLQGSEIKNADEILKSVQF